MYREFAVAGIGVLWRADADHPGDRAHALPEEHTRRVLIPADGCTDLVLHRDELRIAGPSTRVIHADAATPGSAASVGIRFQPGTASEFLTHPLTELRNQSIVADAVIDSRLARKLRLGMEQLAAAPADYAHDLGAELFRELREVRASRRGMHAFDREHPVDWRACVRRSAERGLSLPALLSELDTSERQLHRRMASEFGYGYTALRKVQRSMRARTLLRSGATASDVAARLGFADQSHLTRDLRSTAGVSPAALHRRVAPSAEPSAAAR
ncbi:helix-turn-helix domain-containing protein [Leucobacter musarum]|uniref:helix-turn-helix domain-containing protein n=1 Tax=Leucobacter musarum TaxID=1930747 RepID=UPI0006A78C8C|nr:helix-turn-helix domain-containing protein [Leucobacter musarum]